MKTLCVVALLALTASLTLQAQTTTDKEPPSSHIVERVLIRGNRRIGMSEIKSWISTKKRIIYKPQELDHDVRALYDAVHFDDVRVYVEDGQHGGKIVTFEVIERPLIIDVAFEGIDSSQKAEVLDEWHKQKVEFSEGSECDPVTIKRAANIMQSVLTSKQYQSVKVIPYIERKSATEVSVLFKVEVASQK